LSYNRKTNKIKEEEEYREGKRSRCIKKENRKKESTEENNRERWWNQRANQTAKLLKEGKQKLK
jgi:hypothetical protein